MSKEERDFKSEFIRLMFRAYRRESSEKEFLRLQRELAPKAKDMGVASEEDVERLVLDNR